ncbi:hypothetical protein M514_08360 [Trichuris suis]|uniref:Uncharacterized protein n=1 Tax=Trichuris suis TaxID=68888 RepID=A0A085N149_9BILA|nr:hypothetical protein M514_08360 [Trichuris suis]
MVYVRFWHGSELMGEMLLSRPLTILEETQGYFKQSDIPLDDIIVTGNHSAARGGPHGVHQIRSACPPAVVHTETIR